MTVHSDFYTLFDEATPVPIIFANQNGPRPPKPYITLRLSVASPLPVHTGPTDDAGIRELSAHRAALAQLQVYGPGCWEIAEQLAMSLSKESIQALAETLNITINERVRIQDVPALVDTATYEPRAILDVEASYTTHIDDDVGFIQTVHGEIDTEPGTVPPESFIATVIVTP